MKQLFNGLIKPKIRTVYILMLTGLIVMLSIHTSFSLDGSELQIIKRFDKAGIPHANVISTIDVGDISDYDTLFGVLDSYKSKGVSYEEVDYAFSSLYKSEHHLVEMGTYLKEKPTVFRNGFTYAFVNDMSLSKSKVIEGKDLDKLGAYEIALPISAKSSGFSMGSKVSVESHASVNIRAFNPKNDPMYTYSYCRVSRDGNCYEYFDDTVSKVIELEVVSFFQETNVDDLITQSDFNPGIDFFKPDEEFVDTNYLVSKDTFDTLQKDMDLGVSWDDAVLTYMESLPYYDVYLTEQFLFDNNDEDVFPSSVQKQITINYDNFSRELEDDITRDVDRLQIAGNPAKDYGRFRLNSLASKLDKEPMVTEVLKVLSTYVLVGVLLSSFYSFYIHFRNQIKTSTKEITSLLMQGVRWWKIFLTYVVELGLIVAVSSILFIACSRLLQMFDVSEVLFSNHSKILLKSFVFSGLYFVLLVGVLFISLVTFRKDVLQKFKQGAQTQISFVTLSSDRLIRTLSIKRVSKYLSSTIGFAFSIALVFCVIVLSITSSFHLRNLYSKETFGIQFDYMITHNNIEGAKELFAQTNEYSEAQAQIYKNEGIMFMEHDLRKGNSKYYKSSEIVFVNEIKEFVPLESGTYPPYWKDIKGDPPNYSQTAVVSRRHLDRRNIAKQQSDPKGGYLFYYDNEYSKYETAFEIFGTVNALYNNGWVLSGYQPVYVSENIPMEIMSSQYVVKLKDGISNKEFESLLDTWDIDYLHYNQLIDEFQLMNNSMNETSLVISLVVSILMFSLLLINIGGLSVSAKLEVEEDDILFEKLGFKRSLVKKLNISVILLRIIASIVFIFILITFIYPRYFNDLLGAFGLFSMPGSILKGFVVISLFILMGLVLLFLIITKRRVFED